MKIILKNFLAKAGTRPYRLVIRTLDFLVKKTGVPVVLWPRNSYVLGSLEPGYSDVDLTLCFNERVSFKTMSYFIQGANWFRKICPLLGEINMYRGLPRKEFLKQHNYFELMRDPLLLASVDFVRTPSPEEAAVFLLRQLEKDINQISQFPEKRIKKWQSHFSQIDSKIPELEIKKRFPLRSDTLLTSIQFAIMHALEVANPVIQADVHEKLNFYLELIRCKVNLYQARTLWTQSAWWVCFSPMQKFIHEIPPLPMSDIQIKVFAAQIRWEICGCLTQVNGSNKEFFKNHFRNMQETVQKYKAFLHSVELETLDDLFSEANRYLEV